MKRLVKKVKIGDRFNRLTVNDCFLVKKENQKNKTHCSCICDCGNKIVTRADSLQRGRTQSCGCLHKEKTSIIFTRKENKGYNSGSNTLYNNYRGSAKSRNLEFTLNRELFQYLTQQNCYYCDRPPSSLSRRRKKDKLEDSYLYNGLDRINSHKGYIENNVVTCCQQCNLAKSDLTQEEFYVMIEKIYLNKGKKNGQ